MSLGYVKGKYWVTDDRYAAYASRESYKALIRANNAAGYGTNVEFSYTTQEYMAEVFTVERFKGSAQRYIVKHNNAYNPHPMLALTSAIRASSYATLRSRVCCLEIECEVLSEALKTARERQAAYDALERAIDLLSEAITRFLPPCSVCGGSGFTGPYADYGGVCGHCGGARTEGPGWFTEPLSADPSDVAAAQWEDIQRGVIAYPEDDDL